MSKPSRPRHALRVATAATLAAGAAAACTGTAALSLPAERAALEARVEAVRQALKAASLAPDADATWTLAQATNWTNWPKWSKWSNWANK